MTTTNQNGDSITKTIRGIIMIVAETVIVPAIVTRKILFSPAALNTVLNAASGIAYLGEPKQQTQSEYGFGYCLGFGLGYGGWVCGISCKTSMEAEAV